VRKKKLTKVEREKIAKMLRDGVALRVVMARTGRGASTVYRIRRRLGGVAKPPATPARSWVVFARGESSPPIVESFTDDQAALDRAATIRASGGWVRLAREVEFEVLVSGVRSGE
jgi:hypothetical protein